MEFACSEWGRVPRDGAIFENWYSIAHNGHDAGAWGRRVPCKTCFALRVWTVVTSVAGHARDMRWLDCVQTALGADASDSAQCLEFIAESCLMSMDGYMAVANVGGYGWYIQTNHFEEASTPPASGADRAFVRSNPLMSSKPVTVSIPKPVSASHESGLTSA